MFREYTEVEALQGDYSDIFKDVHGFRPRHASDSQWNSAEWLRKQISELSVELEFLMVEDAKVEELKIAEFETKVSEIIATGAGDRATALRWIFDAEDDEYTKNDRDHFCWTYGLPFGYFKHEVF